MPRARLTLTVPEDVWIGGLSRRHPDARFRILAAIADDDTGVGLVEIAAEDPEGIVADLRDVPELSGLDPLKRDDDEALLQFETTNPLLLYPVQGSGTPLEMPFDIRDGEATWEVTAPQDRLSRLGDQLETFGIRFRVEQLHQRIQEESLLTDNQATLVAEAVDRGYYDTPRTCTLTELADALDMAKSTCSETLHRAEGKVIKRFVERQLEPART